MLPYFISLKEYQYLGQTFPQKAEWQKILKSKYKLAYSNILLLIFIHFAEHQYVSPNFIQKVNSKNIEKKTASKHNLQYITSTPL